MAKAFVSQVFMCLFDYIEDHSSNLDGCKSIFFQKRLQNVLKLVQPKNRPGWTDSQVELVVPLGIKPIFPRTSLEPTKSVPTCP